VPRDAPAKEIPWPRRILTPAEAVKYIDAAGYCMLFPVNDVPLPSLYCAVTRRSPDDGVIFDRHFEMLWRWKDELPRHRRVFYAKYFRSRGTLISLKHLPHFLAMRETAVAPDDHARFYSEGRIRDDARVIWQALEQHGPLATLELRNACKMDTKAGNIRFKRAILDLQCLLLVSHFGAEQETAAWASGRYELTCRAFPKETAAAKAIAPEEARAKLAGKFLEHHPAAAPKDVARLFGWSKDEALTAHGAAKLGKQDSMSKRSK
jgi:winged helix DNA-binding protein